MSADNPSDLPIVRDHRRQWRDFRYIYPVISRRSKGLSIGVNVNPDKRCTFACAYCQVDRKTRREFHDVDLTILRTELAAVLDEVRSGQIWRDERFAKAPPEMRRINDVAFSGDGEPTLVPFFDHAVKVVVEVLRAAAMPEVKLVVITNASQFDQPQFQRALPLLDAYKSEIWAKLDAGSEEFFVRMNHPFPRISLGHILRNIASVARGRHIVIQSLFCRFKGKTVPDSELRAYCRNMDNILRSGGQIKLIQVHTIARPPASADVTALTDAELDAVANFICDTVPVPVETFYGAKT